MAQEVFNYIENTWPFLITGEAERIQGTIEDRLFILASEAKGSYASDIQGYIMDAIFPQGIGDLSESELAVWEHIAAGFQERAYSTIDKIASGTLTDEELDAAIESLSMDSMLNEASIIGANANALMDVIQEEAQGFAEIEETINKGNYNPQEVLADLIARQAAWDAAVTSVLGEGADIPSGYEGRIKQMEEEVAAVETMLG